MTEILKFKCASEKEIAEMTPSLKTDLPGLRTINFNAEAKGVAGFLSFDSAEQCEAAKKIIETKFQDLDLKAPYETNQKKKKQSKEKPNKVDEFFNYDRPPQEEKERDVRNDTQQGQHNQRSNANNNANGRGGRGNNGRGRGGRGRGGFRGRGRAPNMQMIQGHVCVIDGVPFNTTNEQLAKLFGGCGQIYDINRFELMAMIYFDKAECVQNAIVNFNGHKLKDNVLVVSSGGTVKVPIPMVQPPAEMVPTQ